MYLIKEVTNKFSLECVLVDEDVEITYSYWDGSGHRRTIKVKQQDNIITVYCKTIIQILIIQKMQSSTNGSGICRAINKACYP